MKTAVFTIKDHSDIGKTINYLHNNYTQANFENKPLVVEIKPEAKDRSKAQNRLYFRCIEDINKNGAFDKNDKVHYHFVNLLADEWKVEVYTPN